MQVPLIRLQCGVNSYEWGKKGSDSAAAKFAAATPATDFSVQQDKPYAELWMGTHPSNPSRDVQTGRTLLDLVAENQALLSPTVAARFGDKLPFLFKVLSINKALSIQAHPNKALAERLHARDAKNYPDDNHKPEMAIAITPFEGLCGFRPLAEVAHFLRVLPPLRRLVGEDAAAQFEACAGEHTDGGPGEDKKKQALKKAFAGLMGASQESIAAEVKTLVELAKKDKDQFAGGGVPSTSGATLSELVVRLDSQFQDDIGLFVLFFLNFIKMDVGEALFLVADDIHAYVSGDIIECMAASDNVVRAGFTPKFKDVGTLVDMLTYNYAPIDEQKMVPTEYPYATLNRAGYSSGSAVLLYDPPIDEFAVVRSVLRGPDAKATFEPLDGPSIVICTNGTGTISVGPTTYEMNEGYVFFVGSTAELVLESTTTGEDEFVTFKAFCEVEDAMKSSIAAALVSLSAVLASPTSTALPALPAGDGLYLGRVDASGTFSWFFHGAVDPSTVPASPDTSTAAKDARWDGVSCDGFSAGPLADVNAAVAAIEAGCHDTYFHSAIAFQRGAAVAYGCSYGGAGDRCEGYGLLPVFANIEAACAPGNAGYYDLAQYAVRFGITKAGNGFC
ncbi:mannose-6-phosphate isomerase, class I [Cordyceps militaris CM01]|uniref:Mannose-6-phosphate isomerase n=1 Tax=Cordyceps militaris (strain CM01) TaxID=983644 RepID=G3JV06_CORMM|nr:mannose-6-phosphate isomerase, class I [Cordyceps militaris CM01]EGX87682.1 mannose-6-phosphate isomerase, class I [Cordyceps militaris CM01]